eukprot:Filipodium_phascolosomae@DN3356_c0_g1_i1.p1
MRAVGDPDENRVSHTSSQSTQTIDGSIDCPKPPESASIGVEPFCLPTTPLSCALSSRGIHAATTASHGTETCAPSDPSLFSRFGCYHDPSVEEERLLQRIRSRSVERWRPQQHWRPRRHREAPPLRSVSTGHRGFREHGQPGANRNLATVTGSAVSDVTNWEHEVCKAGIYRVLSDDQLAFAYDCPTAALSRRLLPPSGVYPSTHHSNVGTVPDPQLAGDFLSVHHMPGSAANLEDAPQKSHVAPASPTGVEGFTSVDTEPTNNSAAIRRYRRKTISIRQTVVNLLKSMICSAVLFLPHGWRNGGFAFSVVVMCSSFCLSLY